MDLIDGRRGILVQGEWKTICFESECVAAVCR